MWKTLQTGRWNLVKGDRDRLIKVKIMVLNGKEFGTLTNDHLIQDGRLIQVRL